MPINFDAPLDIAAPLAQLPRIFDTPLHRAAQQLIDLGGVSDVRVLQNGRVVTGISGAPATDDRRTDKHPNTGKDPSPRPQESALQPSAPLRQSLCYLIEPFAVR